MNKKVVKLAGSSTAALLIAGTTAFTTLAAMDPMTIVIGSKAYPLAYANDPANAKEMTDAVLASGNKVFIKGVDGSWYDNFDTTNTKLTADQIKNVPAADFKKADGTVVKYGAGDTDAVVTPVVTSVNVSSVSAITSNVLQVALKDAVTTVDASVFAVKDSTGTAVAVSSAALAGWDTSNKTVLVTLGASTTVGKLYTLTSGTTSANFGGKAADTTKPVIIANGVVSTDYNKVKITFTEPVKLDTLKVTFAEKYNSQTPLNIKNFAYASGDNTSVEVTTDDQKANTLYTASIEGITDFTGNVIDKDTTQTFVGQAKPDAKEIVDYAEAIDYNKLYVAFKTKVDPASLANASLTIQEMYNTSNTVTGVARAATQADAKDYSTVKAQGWSDSIATEKAKYAVVIDMTSDLKASTLYKVQAKGLTTLYGQPMSTTDSETYTTFIGKAKPSSAFTFATPTTPSNTTVKIVFPNKLDTTTATNLANYTISEAYGSATLAVQAAELTDSYTVKLTVASMKNTLYKLTVNNVKDIYNNSVKTDSSANVVNFVGAAVSSKIGNVAAILDPADTAYTTLKLTFTDSNGANVSVGATATDVSHYSIDNSIGYPISAKVDSANSNVVKLTVPKTVDGKIYNLTVTGLENSDGVAMDTAGVKTTFVGRGVDATVPNIDAVIPVDNQTIKIYFDRSVSDSTISGPIWDSSNKKLAKDTYTGLSAFKYTDSTGDHDLGAVRNYAYQDPTNANALILRIVTNDAFKSSNLAANKVGFDFTATKVKNTSSLIFAPIADEPSTPSIVNVSATNSSTLRVYFSADMEDLSSTSNSAVGAASPFKIYTTEAGATEVTDKATPVANPVRVQKVIKIDNKTFDLILDRALTTSGCTGLLDGNKAFLYVATGATVDGSATNASAVSDLTGLVEVGRDTGKVYESRMFGVNDSAVTDHSIASINVFMPDKRTIEVYYPESMISSNATDNVNFVNSAINPANYKLVTSTAGNTQIKYGTGVGAVNFDVKGARWDGGANKAILYLDRDITEATDGASLISNVFLAIGQNVKTNTLVNSVKNEVTSGLVVGAGQGLVRQLAPSSVLCAKPAISSASIDATNSIITVNFDKHVVFGGTVDYTNVINGGQGATPKATASNALLMNDSYDYIPGGANNPANIMAALSVTGLTYDDGAAATAHDILTGNVAKISRDKGNTKITIYLTKALKSATNATIKVAGSILSYTGVAADTDPNTASKAVIGAVTTAINTTAPVILPGSTTETDANADGKVESVTFKFDKAVVGSNFAVAAAADATKLFSSLTINDGTTDQDILPGATATLVDNYTLKVDIAAGSQKVGTGRVKANFTNADTTVYLKDFAGNKVTPVNLNASTSTLTLADKVAPVALVGVNTEMLTATTFKVTFSENVTVKADGTEFTNFNYDADAAGAGAPVVITISGAAGTGTNVITLTTAANAGYAVAGTATVDLANTITDGSNAITAVVGLVVAP